jgi:hypothetical protein
MAKFPIPDVLPKNCPNCKARLKWEGVGLYDAVIRREKVDHYRAECSSCGTLHYRDQRGQPVEPAVLNLPPDLSETANSPQGPQPYPGTPEYGVGAAPPAARPAPAPAAQEQPA